MAVCRSFAIRGSAGIKGAHWCGWCQRFEIACEMSVICRAFKVSDRIRTGDRLDHNQELYQLSYAHRASSI